MSHSCGYRKPIRYEERNAVAGSLPAQYSVKEFIASSTPFLTPSINSKSPTTSLAAKGLNSSSPPVFSLIVPHQALNVWRPIPAGHDVCTFQVVVSAAAALRMKGADTTAVPTTAAAVLSARRRPGCSTVFCCRSLRSVVILPPLGLATNTVPVFAGDRMLHARPTDRKPSAAAVAKSIPSLTLADAHLPSFTQWRYRNNARKDVRLQESDQANHRSAGNRVPPQCSEYWPQCMSPLMGIVITCGAGDHDGLGIDHLAHDTTGRVGCHDQNLVQVQLLSRDSLQAAKQSVGCRVGAGEKDAQP